MKCRDLGPMLNWIWPVIHGQQVAASNLSPCRTASKPVKPGAIRDRTPCGLRVDSGRWKFHWFHPIKTRDFRSKNHGFRSIKGQDIWQNSWRAKNWSQQTWNGNATLNSKGTMPIQTLSNWPKNTGAATQSDRYVQEPESWCPAVRSWFITSIV